VTRGGRPLDRTETQRESSSCERYRVDGANRGVRNVSEASTPRARYEPVPVSQDPSLRIDRICNEDSWTLERPGLRGALCRRGAVSAGRCVGGALCRRKLRGQRCAPPLGCGGRMPDSCRRTKNATATLGANPDIA